MQYKNLEEARAAVAKAGKFRAATTANGWKKGDIIPITNPGRQADAGNPYIYVITDSGKAFNLGLAAIDKLVLTPEEIRLEIKTHEDAIKTLSNNLSYMAQSGSLEFDDTEYKVWCTLQALKSKKNDFAKAKEIAKLLNN